MDAGDTAEPDRSTSEGPRRPQSVEAMDSHFKRLH
jgi:hypothetical protein